VITAWEDNIFLRICEIQQQFYFFVTSTLDEAFFDFCSLFQGMFYLRHRKCVTLIVGSFDEANYIPKQTDTF
jgi:hypothetical protein